MMIFNSISEMKNGNGFATLGDLIFLKGLFER
jgi:hypothetical protein